MPETRTQTLTLTHTCGKTPKRTCMDLLPKGETVVVELELWYAWQYAVGMCTFWLSIGIRTSFEVLMVVDSI